MFIGAAPRIIHSTDSDICAQVIDIKMLEALKKTLWATADKLRANMDAAEYKHLVLGLIFLKYVSDTFTARRAELDANREDRNAYQEANAFWVSEPAR